MRSRVRARGARHGKERGSQILMHLGIVLMGVVMYMKSCSDDHRLRDGHLHVARMHERMDGWSACLSFHARIPSFGRVRACVQDAGAGADDGGGLHEK